MIEQLARTSAQGLRSGIATDVDTGLADLYVRDARQRRRMRLGTVAAVVLALGLGWSARSVVTDSGDSTPGPSNPGPSGVPHEPDPGDVCSAALVSCLGDRTYRFALVRPVQWVIPRGFGADSGGGASSVMVESYRQTGPVAGVTVLERVRASSPNGSRPVARVADDPQAFVRWVASRPYLDAGHVVRTALAGHRAWQVRVTLARGAAVGDALCNGRIRCHAITYTRGGMTTGIWDDMAAEYTALRLPDGGTTVVWSWVFSGDPDQLGELAETVHGVSWPKD